MKKLLTPANIAFYVLMSIAFFYAVMIEAGKNQMLAGGAIVLGYGVLFGGIAFVASLFIAYYTKPTIIKRLNWMLLVIVILTIGIVRYLNPRETEETPANEYPEKTTAPTTDAQPAALTIPEVGLHSNKQSIKQQPEPQLNIGFFEPNFYENSTLYLYGGLNLQKGLIEHTPVDSLVFVLDKNGNFITSYAPLWLVPEHMVLDYGIMYFKMQSVGYDFVNVITNKTSGQEAYLDKNAGELLISYSLLS